MRILLAITGASGCIYGIRLLEELIKSGNEVHLIISEDAKKIMKYETNYTFDKIKKKASLCYKNSDLFSAPSSGSYKLDAMVIVPCSMKTLSAIANCYCDTLISRAGICCLKEERKLILVIRETPLDLSAIKNILSAKQAGATILPAMPGFYHKPKKIGDLVDFIIGKILDQLKIDHMLFKRWK